MIDTGAEFCSIRPIHLSAVIFIGSGETEVPIDKIFTTSRHYELVVEYELFVNPTRNCLPAFRAATVGTTATTPFPFGGLGLVTGGTPSFAIALSM
jgi:hypothetical protein